MLLPKQIWRDIPGYENLYQVSNTGKVRSLNYKKTGKVKRLKQHSNNGGYSIIGLWKDGKCKHYLVHRLVAMTFIPNPNNYSEVNHIDENKTNNCVWNLEWCDSSYNANYGSRNERLSKAHRKPIIMLDMNNNPIACFDSVKDANEHIGKDRNYISSIYDCARGGRNTAYGYKWAYLESEVI